MANAVYPKYLEALLDASSNVDLNDGTVKVALVDTGTYTYSAAHDFYDDVSAAVVGTPQTINNTTVTNGLFDGDDVTFSAVTGATVGAVILFVDTGTPGTSRLVCYLDTGISGLPITPSGADISLSWNASGIFQL